jgi:predicted RNase H-like HicB family nuclease
VILAFETIFAPSDEGGYTVEVPSLQGCISEGDDLDHSVKMAIDAASVWILDELESGRPIPEPRETTKDDLSHFNNPIVKTIEVDIGSFAKKHATQETIVRSFEIPIWLNTLAEQKRLNLPETIQAAIIQSVS